MCLRTWKVGEMERVENKKRGREVTKTTNNRKKREIMTTTDDNIGISYKLENMKNNMETTYDEEGASVGVFDFPWLKKGDDVNFRAEIDELCFDTFANPATCCSTSYNFHDDNQETLLIPTSNIITTTSNSCSSLYDDNNALLDQKLHLELELDLNLDLDQFFLENHSTNTGAEESSNADQLNMNKIEDEQLKFQVVDDQSHHNNTTVNVGKT